MKQRFCAMAGRWMFASALAAATVVVQAPGALAQGAGPTTTVGAAATAATGLDCDGTITTAADAAGDPREVCVMSHALAAGGAAAPSSSGSSSGSSSSDHDTRYGILIGATLVIAGSATSLYARRRKVVLGKPFRRRSA